MLMALPFWGWYEDVATMPFSEAHAASISEEDQLMILLSLRGKKHTADRDFPELDSAREAAKSEERVYRTS